MGNSTAFASEDTPPLGSSVERANRPPAHHLPPRFEDTSRVRDQVDAVQACAQRTIPSHDAPFQDVAARIESDRFRRLDPVVSGAFSGHSCAGARDERHTRDGRLQGLTQVVDLVRADIVDRAGA
jgi:hypothetical protein